MSKSKRIFEATVLRFLFMLDRCRNSESAQSNNIHLLEFLPAAFDYMKKMPFI